ncbi:hypothetical protein [Streptomyces swartbergensis]|uniref:Uncharacterized protein n=1 Tax=Streptomyces swartbergensis TaxID=487165 RepID=A0A243S187_9ACTN|nr:hypothetical protein [Streptomyces swartbergensis]OUD01280.1 hypothetical protein CA983_20975 [Streptomyces swartbergensis]
MTQARTAQPAGERAPVFGLITPEDWHRVPLLPADRREASVSALVKRQFAGVDDQPVVRRKAEEQLLGTAETAVGQGGVVLYLSFLEAGGIPLPASLLVSRLYEKFDGLDAVAALAGSGEVTLGRPCPPWGAWPGSGGRSGRSSRGCWAPNSRNSSR